MKVENKLRFLSSLLIGFVFFINVQAGIDFYFNPQKYTSAFELSGIPGDVSVSGVGLLFLMWNIPYAFALWNPIRHAISLFQAILMQTFGVVGETIILFRIPDQIHPDLSNSIERFILFDGIGLIFLLYAYFLVFIHKQEQRGV